jgi:hypothetical protein
VQKLEHDGMMGMNIVKLYQIEMIELCILIIKLSTILTVKTDDTGDYDNLRDVTEFVNAHLIINSNEIYIYPGIYDVLFDYKVEEINAAEYLGDV